MDEYIKREDIIEDFKTDWIELYFDGFNGTPRPKEIRIVDVIERIKDFPAADVEPVRHGRWVNESFYTHCSVCGNMAVYDKYGQEVESDYCPNCGAKMGGENL